MSGHSKWAKIHRNKGTADAKRGTLFTRLGNAISVMAKVGGGDPETNFKLKLAIDKAKAANLPKDNIDRAIARGSGAGSDAQLESITYEGFGPGGVAMIIECLTNNRNRASANIKHLFTKYGGALGAPNSVLWQFENIGTLGVTQLNEALELELIDLGVKDIQRDPATHEVTLICQPQQLKKIKDFLDQRGVLLAFAELEILPKNYVALADPETRKKFAAFTDELDNAEEVNNYYSNAQT